MSRILLSILWLGGSISSLCAQSFFTSPAAQYLTPGWRGDVGTEFSHWDVFYSPSGGINYPDIAAPNGIGQFASAAGFTPPPNANPSDPFAFWNAQNPTLTQTGTTTAFIIGPGTAGNIYSFAEATAYRIADATPYSIGSVVMQFQTDGQLMDLGSIKLIADGQEYAPTNFITEYKSSGSAFGGITNRSAAQWNLTGLGHTSYVITYRAVGSSNSFQELLLDTTPTYSEAVPSARTWNAMAGTWSGAGNWSPGSLPPTGGNVAIVSGNSLTVDGGQRTIGELKLSAPGGFTIDASGGGVLQINTGITAEPIAVAAYTISAPIRMDAFNLIDLNQQTTLTLSGGITATAGFILGGGGMLRIGATTTMNYPISIFDGSLEIASGATLSGSGAINVSEDTRLVVHGTLSGSGTLNPTRGTISGSGTIDRPLTIDTGDTLAPGASVGSLATAAQTWADGGRFQLELADAGGLPGAGWDLVNINGALQLGATGGSFTLELRTLTTGGAAGLMQGFDPAQSYSWRFASATGGISQFASEDFTIDASGFQNPLAGGSFRVGQIGGDLFLNFTPVPEPSTAVLLSLGGAWYFRRRRLEKR
jgi:hypothetical protein